MVENKSHQKIQYWRIIGAFILAPIPPSMILAIFPFIDAADEAGTDWAYLRKLDIILVIGYAATLILALPVYLAFRRRVARSLLLTLILSSATTSSPWLTRFIFAKDDYFYQGGWPYYLQNLAVYALLGFIGGAVFWVVAHLPMNQKSRNT